jgi:hypothetical protein
MNRAEQASSMSRHDLEAKIVKRCWEDAAFGKEFTAGPAGAFVKYLGRRQRACPGSWSIV